jgi:integrase
LRSNNGNGKAKLCDFGYKLDRLETRLRRFLSYLDEKGTSHITTALALEFATEQKQWAPRTKIGYLCAVRGFAQYLAGMDSTIEVPPPGLFKPSLSRFRPYIYSDEEIRRLLAAALRIPSAERCMARYGLKPWILHSILGLLAATGMRINEATGLKSEDIDWSEGVLRISSTKFLKSRLVPVHPSTLNKLRSYLNPSDRPRRAATSPSSARCREASTRFGFAALSAGSGLSLR